MAEKAKEEKHEEYEIIPVSPLRRMEKRIEQLEASTNFDTREFYKEMVDIIRMNQQLVDELAKANDALRIELSRLPSRMEDLISRMDEIISFIKSSATEEDTAKSQEAFAPLAGKLDQLIDANKKIVESNQAVLSTLDEIDKKLKRPLPPMKPLPLIKRPMVIPPKPV